MSPEQLAAKGTESGEQKALFAWAAMARMYGYAIADDMTAYSDAGLRAACERAGIRPPDKPPGDDRLKWLHAIPNGGERTARTAALLKAEGVRKGVADVFLPVPRYTTQGTVGITYCGLYIEMKTTTGKQSEEQRDFEQHCNTNAYVYRVCRSWREAVAELRDYLQ